MPQLIASVEGVTIKHVYLQKDKTTLGRRPTNDIVFDNLVCSGEHCAFHLIGIGHVYVEDLGSTNGTYVNGRMIPKQQKVELHDGDQIGIGRYKIEYVASSGPGGYEATRQMQVTAEDLAAAGIPPPTGAAGGAPQMQAVIRFLAGPSQGLEVPITKAVTTFGKPGTAVVAISHRRNGFFAALMEGNTPPTLNGRTLGMEAVQLANGDVLEMADTKMEFRLTPQ